MRKYSCLINTIRRFIFIWGVVHGGMLCASSEPFKDSLSDDRVVSFGGYIKLDVRHVNGDIGYQDYWIANYPKSDGKTSKSHFNIKESRFYAKITHHDITAFAEIDFYGGGGNEVVSNSSNPRLRHIYFKSKHWLVGQSWSAFMPLHAIPEALDFGGPHVGEVFIRQPQIRYSNGRYIFSVENSETHGDGNTGQPQSAVGLSSDQADAKESLPDVVMRYDHEGLYGAASAAILLRKVNQGGINAFSLSYNLSAVVRWGYDDLRLQVSAGSPGRYVAAGLTGDIVSQPALDLSNVSHSVSSKNANTLEKTQAYAVSYRHYWTKKTRSTLYFGQAKTKILSAYRSHWGLNFIMPFDEYSDVGVEFGRYSIADSGMSRVASQYYQFSWKYFLD